MHNLAPCSHFATSTSMCLKEAMNWFSNVPLLWGLILAFDYSWGSMYQRHLSLVPYAKCTYSYEVAVHTTRGSHSTESDRFQVHGLVSLYVYYWFVYSLKFCIQHSWVSFFTDTRLKFLLFLNATVRDHAIRQFTRVYLWPLACYWTSVCFSPPPPPPSLMTFFPPLSDLFPYKKPFSKIGDMKTLTLSLKTIF